jgi:hypothetical protein
MNATLQKFETMPADVQKEALDFARFLMSQRGRETKSKIVKQGWAGALKDFKETFSSVELQNKAREWRG